MGWRISILGLVGIALVVPSVACDDLALPARPDDGGVTPTGDGGAPTGVVLPAYAPAGAIAGDVKQAMNSTLATWVTLDTAGKVKDVNWNLPLTAVTSLDGAPFDARVWMNFPPEAARDTALTGFAYDWLSFGHFPNGIYDVGHWEFHMVVQDFADVQAIDCQDPTLPAAEIVPSTYYVLPPPDNCFPGMGIHSIHLGAPEFQKERFTYSNMLVYYRTGKLKDVGTKLASMEPKVTTSFLKERKSFTIALPELPPGSIGRATLVPTTLVASYDSANDAFIFTAGGLVPGN